MTRLATRAVAPIRMPFFEQREPAASASRPPSIDWSDPAAYDDRLRHAFLLPLQRASLQHGAVPMPQQVEAANRLHWYFTLDARPMAPTMVVNDAMAAVFHQRIADVMAYIDAAALEAMATEASPEVRHALFSYKAPTAHSAVSIDAYDVEQRLVRVTYFVHGQPPAERFEVDGREVRPAFAKYRACNFFRRRLVRQRIAWIPAPDDATALRVVLDGTEAHVGVGPQPFAVASASPTPSGDATNTLLREAREVYRHRWALPGEAPLFVQWKARIAKALARLPFVRSRYRDAWVFIDRAHDADDSAEHLYRWVRDHHPEINAWFLLKPRTADWQRLKRDGFRLLGPGLRRKLLLLNARHVISTHPESDTMGFDRRVYGDAMHWRFTYLKHGVDQADLSHYYTDSQFDSVIAASPAEYESLVADDTPYKLTAREARRCNVPRHDRLLQLAAEVGPDGADEIIIMPTWRARLIDDHYDFAERMRRVHESEYAREWRGLLNDPRLRELARAHGKRIVLVPHSNLIPYLGAFEVPAHVEVARKGESIQTHFARCCAFITDFTSAAFDVALLRRGVFHFHFDRETFYAGGHNWRPGYFDFERDGLGPLTQRREDLVDRIERFLEAGGRPEPEFVARMTRAMPDQSRRACSDVYSLLAGVDGR